MRKSFVYRLALVAAAVAFGFATAPAQHTYTVPSKGKPSASNKSITFSKTYTAKEKPQKGQEESQEREPLREWMRRHHVADNLTAAVTAGTGGLGLEVSTPVTEWTSLRLGVSGFPQFKVPLDFTISSYADGKVSDNFVKIKDFMLQVTGEEMHEKVTMNCRPKMLDFKMLVDVYPFRGNRRWHFTAGFQAGSTSLGSAINSRQATKSLMAMNIYNRFYDRMEKFDYQDEPLYGDVYLTKEAYDEFMSYGRLGIHLGDRKDGTPYYLTPKPNATVTAKARMNSFKPYLGFGYSGVIDKEKRWNIGFEAGALFWGGAPKVIVNEQVNLNELNHVRGRVGDYLKLVKALPVYPVVDFKISYTFF